MTGECECEKAGMPLACGKCTRPAWLTMPQEGDEEQPQETPYMQRSGVSCGNLFG